MIQISQEILEKSEKNKKTDLEFESVIVILNKDVYDRHEHNVLLNRYYFFETLLIHTLMLSSKCAIEELTSNSLEYI